MPPKAKIAAPIDRPLSRAYLRMFMGWSTAYPPGMSQPNSLRIMENVMITRDGAVRVRPALRLLSYAASAPTVPYNMGSIVGSHEVFFLNDGRKAYLFAVNEYGDYGVTFHVCYETASGSGVFRCDRVTNAPASFVDQNGSSAVSNVPPVFPTTTSYVKYLQIDNNILALCSAPGAGDTIRIFEVGAVKRTRTPKSIVQPTFAAADKPIVRHPAPDQLGVSTATGVAYGLGYSTRTAKTLFVPGAELVSNAPIYNMGYYYTFSNEIGESAPSAVKTFKIRRPVSGWRIELSDAGPASEPNGTDTEDATRAADQLMIWPSDTALAHAVAQGATSFNVYCITWTDQDPVPIEGQLIGERALDSMSDSAHSWVRHTAGSYNTLRSLLTPTRSNRYNYSLPSRATNGVVAADRLILVGDPTAAAQIKWTSNLEYLHFDSNRGGGYKTLTSGNLYVPVAVQLWQNPQSADTLTILCQGVDGQSSAYYMAPIQVASQSDATNGFGFEETTATPGTVASFGSLVLNNSLYRPMEESLIKTTASNYNINHKTMTDLIENKWRRLLDRNKIVASFFDNRIYLIVNNPEGAELEVGCRGNEIWVLDTVAKEGSWSRWLIQSHSLRKISVGSEVYMSVVRPDGIFYLDPEWEQDDVVTRTTSTATVAKRYIPWKFETNTQGANRAHDAWCRLQQLNITFGNYRGEMTFGIRGWDLNGRKIDMSKVSRQRHPGDYETQRWDVEDYLLIRRDMKEWSFYAQSNVGAPNEVGVSDAVGTVRGSGQISLVQYRYAPVSVNVGYEYGSIETFEYGADKSLHSAHENGVPVPVIDYGQP